MAVTLIGNKLQVEVLADESTKTQLNEVQQEVKSTKTQLNEIQQEVSDLDSRVDTIIAGTVDGVSGAEIVDARQGEVTLGANITKVKSQLAQKLNLHDWELQNKSRKQKPIFTIVDDDGHLDVIDKLLPLANQYDFKFTATVPGFNMLPTGEQSHMKKDDLLLLQSMGHEISSHTYNHIHLIEKTESELIDDFEQMDALMKSWGINCNTLCYPFGERNDLSIEVARKYVRGARTTEYGINYSPLETWDLKVINGWTSEAPDSNNTEATISYYKTKLDEVKATNGWGIFSAHLYLDENQTELIEELVIYAQSLGIEIVTLNEGFNRFGNIVDIGRYWKQDLTKNHYAVGVNGNVVGDKTQNITRYTRGEEITNETPPNHFELGKLHKTRVLWDKRAGFPEENGGSLTTDAVTAIDYGNFIVQHYESLESKCIYKRFAIGADTWSAWERTNSEFDLVVKMYTAVTPDSPVTDFPANRISYINITWGDRTGFPPSEGGTLMTNRIIGNDAYAYQEYDCLGSHDKHKRYWAGGWSAWKKYIFE